MKIPISLTLCLLMLKILCEALKVEPTLYDLIFYTNKNTVRGIFTGLFEGYISNLNFLLQLASCDYFELANFMPSDLSLLKPVIHLLKHKQCPLEIQERFYNFKELQRSEEGRNFLIDSKVNFATYEWDPYLFAVDKLKEILGRINKSSPRQLECLEVDALLLILRHDRSNFFSTNQHWNIFGIASMTFEFYSNDEILCLWLKQVELHVATDNLLFYRLAFLYWSSQSNAKIPGYDFAEIARKLLEKSLTSEFRVSVYQHYAQKGKYRVLRSLLKIGDLVLKEDAVSQAILHFEHLIAAFKMGYKVPKAMIITLFKKFKPYQVSPLHCRTLLGNLSYYQFTASILKAIPREWKEEYWQTNQAFSYFPRELLSANVQSKLWRHSMLFLQSFFSTIPMSSCSFLRTWSSYIDDEYLEVAREIAIEKSCLTFIDCNASQKLITLFIRGRLAEFLLHDKILPRFIPLLQEHNHYFMGQEVYDRELMRDKLVEALCMKKENKKATYTDANNSLNWIKGAFESWNVPRLLFASL